MKMRFKAIASFTGVAAALLLGACTADADSPGLEYMPDMYRSPAIEPYVDYGEIRGRENMDLKMELSARTPAFGTVPYYGTNAEEVMLMLPYNRKANLAFRETHGLYGADLSSEDEYMKAAVDVNILKLTADNSETIFKKGKELYLANCVQCHGEKGDGNGKMVQNGLFAGVPEYTNLTDKSDGQLFYSIYYGKGAMGAHNSIVNKKEIWTLVHYIRKFQNPDYGTFNATGTATAVTDTTQLINN